MTPIEFFTAEGGIVGADNFAENNSFVAHFGDYSAECDAFEQSACLCAIGTIGLIRVVGSDATNFLHNLLSSNVKALPAGQGQFSTLNSPKGRMLASFFLWRAGEADDGEATYYLLLASDLAAAIQKRLAMYVLRAKVKVENVSGLYTALGICGAKTRNYASIFTEQAANDGEVFSRAGTFTLALPGNRRLLIFAPERLSEYWKAGTPSLKAAGRDLWQRARILSGIPLITAPTSDKLIPLEVNFDALGGVDFNKGCYTGQEIIARTRYLGRLKTRMFLARTPYKQRIAPTTPVLGTTFGQQSCGQVVNSAPDRNGQLLLIALQTAAEQDELRLANLDGATLELLPLAYEVPEYQKTEDR